jgi:phosphopantothenoylcysteine decarboxylase
LQGQRLSAALAAWADILVFAPLSANTLAKLALGLCDNLATEVARSWSIGKALILAPAMNTKMWAHPATGKQLDTLQGFGNVAVIAPVSKKLACGDTGVGAMASVQDICDAVMLCEVV